MRRDPRALPARVKAQGGEVSDCVAARSDRTEGAIKLVIEQMEAIAPRLAA